ncbi:MAG: AbrB/MazE/SpoVT family DNA-binding domain-containing protein [Chloroflexi bacterium]|nr:AbrB/MazE/SpoVT family DNA-binding domain-containing protein [Chloroflexota bacterium]
MQQTVTLRQKNQITLPHEIVRELGMQPGDRLVVEFDSERPGKVELRPVRRSYAGIAEGLYGGTLEEELAYIREERASWEQ